MLKTISASDFDPTLTPERCCCGAEVSTDGEICAECIVDGVDYAVGFETWLDAVQKDENTH